jgi:hypothetical protein
MNKEGCWRSNSRGSEERRGHESMHVVGVRLTTDDPSATAILSVASPYDMLFCISPIFTLWMAVDGSTSSGRT